MSYDDVDSPDYREHNLGDPRMTADEKEIARLTRDRAELIEALRACVNVAKAWHGEVEWDTYFGHSPEMKLVREALAKHEKVKA